MLVYQKVGPLEMLIKVSDIPRSGLHIHLEEKTGWLSDFVPTDDVTAPVLAGPLSSYLELYKKRQLVKIKGFLKGVLKLECNRCGEAFDFLLEDTFDFNLVGPQFWSREDDVELKSEEMDYEFFDGENIHVEKILVEQIFLALPQKILCSKQCKGLCPHCGINLNQDSCECGKDQINPKFEALANWKPL